MGISHFIANSLRRKKKSDCACHCLPQCEIAECLGFLGHQRMHIVSDSITAPTSHITRHPQHPKTTRRNQRSAVSTRERSEH